MTTSRSVTGWFPRPRIPLVYCRPPFSTAMIVNKALVQSTFSHRFLADDYLFYHLRLDTIPSIFAGLYFLSHPVVLLKILLLLLDLGKSIIPRSITPHCQYLRLWLT
ncbi:hypothetical protein IQ274_00155 [Nostoc sp. LEGE 12447]|nr:hypothetical protein [Nostoc sp. LEGE 12447]